MRTCHLGWLAALSCAACTAPFDEASLEQPATVCADGPTVRGMDVSYYETSIDWNAAHAAGIDFAFIRVSDGTSYLDPKFPAYWQGARDAGVLRGAYQFFRPAEDPIAQADLLLEKMGPLAPGDLPPVIDVEVNGGLTQAQVADAVQRWVDHVTAAIGRPPIIYAGLYSWHDLTNSADITTSPLWVAQYTSAACPNIPTPWTRWMFWQNTSTGSVAGVPGSALDLDIFNGTKDDLVAFANNAPPPACGMLPAEGGMIDDGDACFTAGGPSTYLRPVTGAGEENDLIWTHATASADEANFAQWNLNLEAAGHYKIEVFTQAGYAASKQAAYQVRAAGATTMMMLDQSAADGWQTLGEADFAAGGDQFVHLGDNTGEAVADEVQLAFDAVRLTRIDDGATTPPPSSGGCATTGGSGGLPLVLLALLCMFRPWSSARSRASRFARGGCSRSCRC